MKFSHLKGFTLVELMIVIAILGILFVSMQQFNASPSIYQEKANRLANHIHDIIRDTKYQMILWATEDGGKIPVQKEVIISKDNQNITIKTYFNDNTSEEIYSWSIQFDSDLNYKIEKINPITSSWWTILTGESQICINFTRDIKKNQSKSCGTITYDPSNYEVIVDYKWFKRYVIIDSLTNNVEVQNKPWNRS